RPPQYLLSFPTRRSSDLVPRCSRPAALSRGIRFRNFLSSCAAHRRRDFILATHSIAQYSRPERSAARSESALAARLTRRFCFFGNSLALLRRDLARVANFFPARRDQLACFLQSDRCFAQRPRNRGNIFSRTRSRRSAKNQTKIYIDLCHVGVVFHRPFFESARTNV